jgi:hypothetical protein
MHYKFTNYPPVAYEKKLKGALEEADLEQAIKEATEELSVRKESVSFSFHKYISGGLMSPISSQAKRKLVRSKPDL